MKCWRLVFILSVTLVLSALVPDGELFPGLDAALVIVAFAYGAFVDVIELHALIGGPR